MDSKDESLSLGLGFPFSLTQTQTLTQTNHIKQPPLHHAEPSLTLSLDFSGDAVAPPHQELSATSSPIPPPPFVSVKREREATATSDEEEDRSPTAAAAADASAGTTRKKLRLNKDQSALLEDSFKQHSTLNPKQKQALADRLNLRPRQVEVWFQNRRARTKLKQTEVDCEQLKKCCENLTDENRRLQRELQELKALKLGHPHHHQNFYMQLAAPAATLTMCPTCCQRINAGAATGVPLPVPIAAATPTSNHPLSFTLGPGSGPKTHFYPSFSNPSAAC